ncbi:ATP-binding protein [Demetria terragena]|uniref:ATP-binding protein n=1 Tax=Demetria terragena TaxID=63959 RepID=UPI00035FFA36|nr:ATP-binding protein [Demetria terragena]
MASEADEFDLVVRVMGVTIAVPLNHDWLQADDRARLIEKWSYAALPEPSAEPHDLVLDSPGVSNATALDRLESSLSTAVTVAALTHQAGRLLMLHAAGLSDPATGKTIALVAPSGTGKTTAARTLGADWGYVSDETVAIDPADLTVLPHQKPLSIGAKGSIKEQAGPAELGLEKLTQTPTLARIVMLVRDPDHEGPPRIDPLPLAQALGRLVSEVSYLSRWESPIVMMSSVIDKTGGVLLLTYSDAKDLRDLPEVLLETPGHVNEWRSVDDPGTHDAIATDTELVIFLDGQPSRVMVLDGIGPTIWRAARTGDDLALDDFVAAVVAEHGEPPNGSARSLVEASLNEMRDQGVLETP